MGTERDTAQMDCPDGLPATRRSGTLRPDLAVSHLFRIMRPLRLSLKDEMPS